MSIGSLLLFHKLNIFKGNSGTSLCDDNAEE